MLRREQVAIRLGKADYAEIQKLLEVGFYKSSDRDLEKCGLTIFDYLDNYLGSSTG